jgi:septal ring factor EnvC (AmiA/AmiB activator)
LVAADFSEGDVMDVEELIGCLRAQKNNQRNAIEAATALASLSAENARLQHDLEVTGAQYARVSAENAKLRAELAAARESALEEAAKVADEDAEHDWSDGVPRGGMIATAIRALKGTPPHE